MSDKKSKPLESMDLALLDTLKSDISALVAPAAAIKVSSFETAQSAVDAAKQVRELSKRIDTARKSMVDPLNARVKIINEYAKTIGASLLNAELHLKNELAMFEREQEKVRLEALRKAEELQRKRDAELKAKQEAERAALAAKVSVDQELAEALGDDSPEAAAISNQEAAALIEKQAQEQAIQKHEFAAKQWDIDQLGVKNARKIWKCEVVDIDLVPKEYLIRELNEKAILGMARAGVTNIPGVRVWQETSIAIGATTYVPKLALKQKVDGS